MLQPELLEAASATAAKGALVESEILFSVGPILNWEQFGRRQFPKDLANWKRARRSMDGRTAQDELVL